MFNYRAATVAAIALLATLGTGHAFQDKGPLQPSLSHARADKQASVTSTYHAEENYAAGRALEDSLLKPASKGNGKFVLPTPMETSSKSALPVELQQHYYYIDDYTRPRQYHAWLNPSSSYNQPWRPPYNQWSYYSQWPSYGSTGLGAAGWSYPSLPYYTWLRGAANGFEDLALPDYGPVADVISPAYGKMLPAGNGYGEAKYNNAGNNLPYLRFFNMAKM